MHYELKHHGLILKGHCPDELSVIKAIRDWLPQELDLNETYVIKSWDDENGKEHREVVSANKWLLNYIPEVAYLVHILDDAITETNRTNSQILFKLAALHEEITTLKEANNDKK